MSVLDEILDDLRPAAERVASRGRARRRRAVAAAAAAAVVSMAGLGVAADRYLGQPASQPARDEIAASAIAHAYFFGRVDVKLETARVVAIANDAVFYVADARERGYCSFVLAQDATAHAKQCHRADAYGRPPSGAITPPHLMTAKGIELEHMLYDPAAPLVRMVVAGRAIPASATAVELRHRDGTRVPIQLGADRFFVHVDERAREPFTVVALDATGKVVARKSVVPPLPLRIDFEGRRVTRISGRAESPRIDHLEIGFNVKPDRGLEIVRVGADRRFDYRVPQHYRDARDFFVRAATNEGMPVAQSHVIYPAYFEDLRGRLAGTK